MDNNFLNLPSVVFEGRRVINNIKQSAALYLMKTLFITILATICIFMKTPYFFQTNNMLLFEIFVAGAPSTILSLQPNSERVRGKFILHVLSRAIPSAITLTISVMAVYLGNFLAPDVFGQNFQPLLVIVMTFTGLVALYRILQPFNVLRAAIYAVMFAACVVMFAVPVLGEISYTGWSEVSFNVTEILFALCILLAAFPISSTLTKVCDLMNSSD